jgi:BlaI family transcriptional regulator, penicillinase repressor
LSDFVFLLMTPAQLTDLTDLHLAILSALWRRGEATIAELHEGMASRTGASPKTIATLLSRLEKRGLVTSRRTGRESVYRARVTRKQVLLARVSGMLGAIFPDDTGAAAAVSKRDTKRGDAERLRALLRKAQRDLE